MTVDPYRWVRFPLVRLTATPNVRCPVSSVVFSCQPVCASDREMIWPSSPGFAVGSTHASKLMLPVPLRDGGVPRSTKLDVPSKFRALPYLPAVVHVVLCSVPVTELPEASLVVVPVPSEKP